MIFDIDKKLSEEKKRFDVLGGTERSQVALMTIAPGEASNVKQNVHPGEDQLLYIVRGELVCESGEERRRIQAGQLILIPAGTPHRLVNEGDVHAETLNVYSPPAF